MHKAKACVLTCIDFRFQKAIHNYLVDKSKLGDIDVISVAGSSRDLILPIDDIDGKYLWKQIGISVKLHDPDEIIIIDHQDCGGYAQDNTIPCGLSQVEDLKLHKKILTDLLPKLLQKYPKKKITFMYVKLDGEIVEIEI